MQGGQKRPLTHLEKGKLSTVVIGMCWAFNSYLQAKRRRCPVFSFTPAGIYDRQGTILLLEKW